MPVMNGLEATKRIRKLPGGSNVKIVAVTASAFAEQEQELREAGIDDYVRKPFRLEKIYHCLERQLGLKWTYVKEDTEQRPPLVAPPGDLLDKLSQMIDEGRIFEIQEFAARLESMNETYSPFAQKLLKLAKEFNLEQIKAFTRKFQE